MAYHLYFVPAIGTGSKNDPIRPKYVEDLRVTHTAEHVVRGVSYLVAADVSSVDDAVLSSQPDVDRIDDDSRVLVLTRSPIVNSRVSKRGYRLGPITR